MQTLNDVRLKKNLKFKVIGEYIGLSESYCSLLIRGKRRMSLEIAEKLAKVFNMTIDEIFLLYDFSKRKDKMTA